MARMVAQRNSRRFQSTLLDRENALDAHILALLEKFADDPTFFKKKHGYNVHGQMLGKNGKMIVKVFLVCKIEERGKIWRSRTPVIQSPCFQRFFVVFARLSEHRCWSQRCHGVKDLSFTKRVLPLVCFKGVLRTDWMCRKDERRRKRRRQNSRGTARSMRIAWGSSFPANDLGTVSRPEGRRMRTRDILRQSSTGEKTNSIHPSPRR